MRGHKNDGHILLTAEGSFNHHHSPLWPQQDCLASRLPVSLRNERGKPGEELLLPMCKLLLGGQGEQGLQTRVICPRDAPRESTV